MLLLQFDKCAIIGFTTATTINPTLGWCLDESSSFCSFSPLLMIQAFIILYVPGKCKIFSFPHTKLVKTSFCKSKDLFLGDTKHLFCVYRKRVEGPRWRAHGLWFFIYNTENVQEDRRQRCFIQTDTKTF